MSEDMVERVARAIFRNGIGELVWSVATDEQRDACTRQARAAIEAMREPVGDMPLNGWLAFRNSRSQELDGVDVDLRVGTGAIKDVWRAMLNSALTHPVQSSSSPPVSDQAQQ